MKTNSLLEKTIESIRLLPEHELMEIHDFAEFLLSRLNEKMLSDEVSEVNIKSGSFKFLEDDEDLYTVNDLKVKYGK